MAQRASRMLSQQEAPLLHPRDPHPAHLERPLRNEQERAPRVAEDLQPELAVFQDVLFRKQQGIKFSHAFGCVGQINGGACSRPHSRVRFRSLCYALFQCPRSLIHHTPHLHDIKEANGVDVQAAVQPVHRVVAQARAQQLSAGQTKVGQALRPTNRGRQ